MLCWVLVLVLVLVPVLVCVCVCVCVQVVRMLRTNYRLLITGTPLQVSNVAKTK